MENECKKYLSTGSVNFIIVVWSDRGGPGPHAPPSESASGAKGDWDFQISDLINNPDGTDI